MEESKRWGGRESKQAICLRKIITNSLHFSFWLSIQWTNYTDWIHIWNAERFSCFFFPEHFCCCCCWCTMKLKFCSSISLLPIRAAWKICRNYLNKFLSLRFEHSKYFDMKHRLANLFHIKWRHNRYSFEMCITISMVTFLYILVNVLLSIFVHSSLD